MNQAEGYVEDLLKCGLFDGPPRVSSFVVGNSVSDRLTPVRRVADPEVGRIEAVSIGQLVGTANIRLFRVRDQVQERYPDTGLKLVSWLQDRPEQLDLLGLTREAPKKAQGTAEDGPPVQ